MTVPARDHEAVDGFRPYPAPGRTEQPMPRRPSVWPWVVAVGVFTVVLVVAPIVLYWLVASGFLS